MLLSYIENNYRPGEPIFTSDIKIDGLSESNKRQSIKKLVELGKLNRFENGVYYLPKVSRLKGGVILTSDMVAQYKYIARKGSRIGYYAGHTFANRLGISTQVPVKEEIVSNNMAAIVREVSIGTKKYVVRKPVVTINEENYQVLQLLDLLKDIYQYADNEPELVRERLTMYIQKNRITRDKVDQYIVDFPLKTYKHIYEMRLDYVLA